ncbi:hypothetical protein EB796_006624 [Bugula neritina]|uniref:Uncharacterized protein n=1 Tax=Bugula neritina TaxID=10212 RepID=A0A7J7KA60_BUGNE|nr:hypothetical protein EB796_006624 [Bugula neritina]
MCSTFYRNDEKNKERKLHIREKKLKEANEQTYKIRPGPEPVTRYEEGSRGKRNKQDPNIQTESSTHAATEKSQTGFKQRNGAANDLTVSMENGRSTSNSTQLPSLNIANEKPQTEKKKKKKKKRKHIDEESGVELSGYNNLVYDDMGHSASVPT